MLPSIAIPLRRCGSASDMAQRKGATKSEGATEGVGQGLRGRYFGTYIQDKTREYAGMTRYNYYA